LSLTMKPKSGQKLHSTGCWRYLVPLLRGIEQAR